MKDWNKLSRQQKLDHLMATLERIQVAKSLLAEFEELTLVWMSKVQPDEDKATKDAK